MEDDVHAIDGLGTYDWVAEVANDDFADPQRAVRRAGDYINNSDVVSFFMKSLSKVAALIIFS